MKYYNRFVLKDPLGDIRYIILSYIQNSFELKA